MNNLIPIFCFCLFAVSPGFKTGCSQNRQKITGNGETIELSGDGSWGYAGRFAYIANNMLFYSYLDQEGKNWVASYDYESGEITRNNIWEGQADLHSANPLFIRPDGRIQVFLDKGGYTDRNIFWKVSVEPFSVEKFGELQESGIKGDIIQGRQFYPMVHRASGNVYLIINALREDVLRETVMWKSVDGGDTWTGYNNLWGLGKGLDGNRCYTRAYMEGDDIHFVTLRLGWNEPLAGNDIGMVEGVYYTKYNVVEESFFYADGTLSFSLDDTPLYETNYFDEIWHWSRDGKERQRALWSDIVADESGKPYITIAVQESVPQGESALHTGFRATPDEEGEWNFYKVAKLARGWDNKPERKNYGIAIDPVNPERVYVARSTSVENDLSEIHRMESGDGGKTWYSDSVLSQEGRVTTVVVPRVLDQSERKVELLWLDGLMEGWRDYNTRVMMFLRNNKRN